MDALTKERAIEYLAELLAESTDQRLCEELFPEVFCVPFTPLHSRIFRVAASPMRQKLILAPRGIGKTSIVRALIIKAIISNQKHCIVYIGNSSTLAEMQTENIKHELLTNPFIRKTFGDVRESIVDANFSDFSGIELDESFSKKSWVAFGRTLVLPRGCGQQIRGLNWRGFRPDFIILDDPENRKELKNEDIRTENKRWLFGDVLQSVDNARKNHDVFYIDTLKHEDAMPMTLQEMGGWEFDILSICDPDKMKAGVIDSLAPAFKTNDEIKTMIDQYTLTGDLDVFYQEYMNIATAPQTASFKREYFRYFTPADPTVDWTGLETVVIMDPAKSETPQADYSAATVVSLDYKNHKILIRESIGGHYYPDKFFELGVLLADKYGTKTIGFEETGLSSYAKYPLNLYLNSIKRTDIEIVWLKAEGKKKELRIAGLIPLYRRGFIYHNKELCHELEAQLLSFPHSRRDDNMDSEAYLIKMFNIGERFFSGVTDPYTHEVTTPGAVARQIEYMNEHRTLTDEELLDLEYGDIEDAPMTEGCMYEELLSGNIFDVYPG